MTEPKNKGGRPKGRMEVKSAAQLGEREISHAIYAGVVMYDMEQLFKVTRRTVQRKLAGIPPSGKRGVYDTWHLRDVAGLFVRPVGNMEDYLKTARPGDMPPELVKEYWNGQRAKQSFLREEGDLWQTVQVARLFGELVQKVRTTLLLVPDDLERKAALTDTQRESVRTTIDNLLETMRKMMVENFNREPTVADLPGVFAMRPDPLPEDDDYDDVFDAASDEDEELDTGDL